LRWIFTQEGTPALSSAFVVRDPPAVFLEKKLSLFASGLRAIPIAATTAFKHDHSPMQGRRIQIDGPTGRVEAPYFQQTFWAGLVTVAYLPSTAFPTGVDKEGLPIGLQAIGDGYDDLITIDFTRLLAKEMGGFVPPPGYDD